LPTTSRSSPFHDIVLTSSLSGNDYGETNLFSWSGKELGAVDQGDFDPSAGISIEVTTFLDGETIIQVLPTEVRTFDSSKCSSSSLSFASYPTRILDLRSIMCWELANVQALCHEKLRTGMVKLYCQNTLSHSMNTSSFPHHHMPVPLSD
jgi:hypothetical protein